MHPVDVPPQGIDLAVVGQEVIGVSPFPTGEGVGGKTGVYQGQGRYHLFITQIREVLIHLYRHQHPLVDNGAGGDTGNIPVVVHFRIADLMDGALIGNVELTVEGSLIKALVNRLQEQLTHQRLTGLGSITQRRVVSGHITPAKDMQLFLMQNPLKDMTGAVALCGLWRGKHHGNAVLTLFRQFYTQRPADLAQKTVRHLQQDTGAVTGIMLTADRTAVVQIGQDSQRLLHDIMGLFPLDIGDKTNTTGIMLKPGIVQSLLFGYSDSFHSATLVKI